MADLEHVEHIHNLRAALALVGAGMNTLEYGRWEKSDYVGGLFRLTYGGKQREIRGLSYELWMKVLQEMIDAG